jgi:hypothetical protein
MGFHSNDARVAVESGAVTADGSKIQAVPRIYAGEFGARFRWGNRGTISAALWASYLENETVFDADAATYVPADPSRRWGVDVDLRAHPVEWLTLDFELAQASAEALRPDGQTAGLALAPRLYATGGVTASWRGLGAGLRFRYLGARPAFDSDTPEYRGHPIDTDPYVVFDAWVAYRWRWLEAELGAQNLFDRDWREAQVGNRSCTRDETYNPNSTHYGSCASILAPPDRVGVPDVHFTPGVPFNLQLTLRVYF